MEERAIKDKHVAVLGWLCDPAFLRIRRRVDFSIENHRLAAARRTLALGPILRDAVYVAD